VLVFLGIISTIFQQLVHVVNYRAELKRIHRYGITLKPGVAPFLSPSPFILYCISYFPHTLVPDDASPTVFRIQPVVRPARSRILKMHESACAYPFTQGTVL
jgi:hypothetical protein